MSKWSTRFLDLAHLVASWSKDPSTKCGAVIVRPDRTVASVGFNGFPKGCRDDDEFYQDRERKLQRVVHAEANAILHAKESLEDCSLYCTHPTCSNCSALIIQSGIRKVVAVAPTSELGTRWTHSFAEANELYVEANVTTVWIADKHYKEKNGIRLRKS